MYYAGRARHLCIPIRRFIPKNQHQAGRKAWLYKTKQNKTNSNSNCVPAVHGLDQQLYWIAPHCHSRPRSQWCTGETRFHRYDPELLARRGRLLVWHGMVMHHDIVVLFPLYSTLIACIPCTRIHNIVSIILYCR